MLCTRTYSPNILAYIATTGKFLFLSDPTVTFYCLLWRLTMFLGTSLPRYDRGILRYSFPSPSYDYRYTAYISISTELHPHNTYILTNFLQKQSPTNFCTYVISSWCTYYVFVLHFLHSGLLNSLSHTFNPACAKNIIYSTRQHTYFLTCRYLYVSPTQNGQLRDPNQHLLTFCNIYILSQMTCRTSRNVTSSHQENHFSNTFLGSTHYRQSSVTTSVLKSSDTTLLRGLGYGWRPSVHTSDAFSA